MAVLLGAASKIEGVSKVLSADDDAYDHSAAENIAGLVVELGEKYSHIMTPTTTLAKTLCRGWRLYLTCNKISDISGVISEDTFERPIYAGNAIATVQSTDETKVLTVRGTAFDAVSDQGGNAEIEVVGVKHDTGLTVWNNEEIVKQDRPELTSRLSHYIRWPRNAEW